MKILFSTLAVIAFGQLSQAEVTLTVGEINDKRTTGEFFAGLEIALKLSGPELAEAKGMRVNVKSASDDTGKALPEPKNKFRGKDEFEKLQKGMGGRLGKSKDDEFEVKLEFGNPPRAAKAVKEITGSIELLIPSKDPAAVINASLAKDAGKPLDNPALKAAGVEFTLKAPKKSEKKESGGSIFGSDENGISYEIKDPKSMVASVEVFDAGGKKLEPNGHMSGGFGGAKSVTISFSEKPPADATIKIYLVTEKSVISVPLALKNIALP